MHNDEKVKLKNLNTTHHRVWIMKKFNKISFIDYGIIPLSQAKKEYGHMIVDNVTDYENFTMVEVKYEKQ